MQALSFTPTENLLSAWNAYACGAAALSHTGSGTCAIVVSDYTIRVAVSQNGHVVDTAVFEIGARTFELDSERKLIAITDPGETFLNALAKDISVGDTVEEDTPELLGNLIAETVVNLLVRRLPPQISMRMLEGEPLCRLYPIERFLLCSIACENEMQKFICNGLQESLAERNRVWQRAECPNDADLIAAIRRIALPGINKVMQTIENAPVILIDPADQKQFGERMRRFAVPVGAPYAVLEQGMIALHGVNDICGKVEFGRDPALYQANWFLSVDESDHVYEASLLEVQLHGSE